MSGSIRGPSGAAGPLPLPGPDPAPARAPSLAEQLLARRDRAEVARLGDVDPARLVAGATPEQRADLVDLLQRGHTGKQAERAIRNILRSTPVDERDLVLRRIDLGNDEYTVDKLVNDDIDNPGIRRDVANLVVESRLREATKGRTELGVVTDFDDTLVPQLDDRYRSRGVIPGMATLLKELEVGPQGRGRSGDIHLVTARPPGFGNPAEKLAGKGFPAVTVNRGNLFSVAFDIGGEKARDIARIIALNPKQKFVFFGDNAQQDAKAYAKVLRDHPDNVAAALVRRVDGKVKRDEKDYPGVTFFSGDGADAAKILFDRKVITADQYARVAEAARRERG